VQAAAARHSSRAQYPCPRRPTSCAPWRKPAARARTGLSRRKCERSQHQSPVSCWITRSGADRPFRHMACSPARQRCSLLTKPSRRSFLPRLRRPPSRMMACSPPPRLRNSNSMLNGWYYPPATGPPERLTSRAPRRCPGSHVRSSMRAPAPCSSRTGL
jgi:hypothetical protein